ncbi:MAG TPA: CNP1-like family protein [Burkholderiales bacterium]|nr:CNP1-like family protein [Burkholderiales bacterium]
MRAAPFAPLLAAAVLAACGHVEEKSDWERGNEARLVPSDEVVAPPAYPRERDLIEFSAGPASPFRFFVDSASLNVDRGVVRYTLVARSNTGAENVSFEGMRCTAGDVRIYALGRGGEWFGKPGPWRTIDPRSAQHWHVALYREYFCPQREPVGGVREALLALRSGGASFTGSLKEDIPRGY